MTAVRLWVSRMACSIVMVLSCAVAQAQGDTSAKVAVSIDAQPIRAALQAFGKQTGVQVLFRSEDAGVGEVNTPRVAGELSARETLERMLKNTGLKYEFVNEHTVRVSSAASVVAGEADPPDDRKDDSKEVGKSAPQEFRAGEVDQGPAGARVASGKEKKEEPLAEIVVTGTHIRGVAPVGSPLTTITDADIQQAGFTTTQQILASLPQNTGLGPTELGSSSLAVTRQLGAVNDTGASGVNLRGLGPYSTLVLINGHRIARGGDAGIYFDVSMIPVSAISRVEILTDGASSIYGSDAVGGVVNFILKRDYTGAETAAKAGWLSGGDRPEYQLSQVIGKEWGSGSLLTALDFYHRDRLPASFSPFYNDDLTSVGGPDLRSQACNPGNIVGATTTYGIPSGQNGVGLTPSKLVAGQPNLCSSREGTDILGSQRRYSALVSFRQDISDGASVFADVTWSERHFHQRVPDGNQPGAQLSVPSTNPYYVNPDGGTNPVTVQYSFAKDVGEVTLGGKTSLYAATLGGKMGLAHEWQGELTGTISESRDNYSDLNEVNTARVTDSLALSDPTLALNVFGDGPVSSAAILNNIRGFLTIDSRTKVWNLLGRADGPLFDIGENAVRLAVGAEYRRESFSYNYNTFEFTETPVFTQLRPLSRSISAAYGELLVPVVGGSGQKSTAVRSLDLSVSGRFEHYSDFGDTTNPKIGLSWKTFGNLNLRASYGRSFRAPSFREERQDPGSAAYFVEAIPNASGGTSPVFGLFGNKPGLGPEKSKTTTAGIDAVLPFFEPIKLSATYFDIEYESRISDLGSYFFQALTDPTVSSIVTRNPTDAELNAFYASPLYIGSFAAGRPVAIVDARTQNITSVELTRFGTYPIV